MKLIPLLCPTCRHSLVAENEDVVVQCPNCSAAVQLLEDGFRLIRVRYVQANAGTTVSQWLPVWVFLGRVHLRRRETQGGNQNAAAQSFWAEAKRLYVPAWELSLKIAQDKGTELILSQPEFQPLASPSDGKLTAATVSPEDARRLLELMIIGIEADRKDWLKTVEVELDLEEPELWAMPAHLFHL